MHKPTIYPLQFFGLGDIIFTQHLIRELAAREAPITWGVLPQFIEGLQRAYPDIRWVDYRDLKIDYDCKVDKEVAIPMAPHARGITFGRLIPIRWADQILGLPYKDCMRAKYMLYGMDYREWKYGAMWQRDKEKENELYETVVRKGKPYVLINRTFQSDSKGYKYIFPDIADEIDVVYMEPSAHNDFSLFDWAKVIENAEEVHTVSTSLLYLLELLNLKAPAHLYERPTDPGFKQVDYLFTKPYILHQ